MKKILLSIALAALLLSSTTFAEKGKDTDLVLSASASTVETLKKLMASQKQVTVILKNGKEYSGLVKEVSTENVLLTQLAQRSFYDAIIKTEQIAVLEVMVRNR